MTAYDPKKAATFNRLRQQGLSEDAAATQAGITEAESGNYSIGTNGQMGPVIAGTGTVTQAPTAAQQAESARFEAGLQSSTNFEQVDFAQTSRSQPGETRPVTYTTTSTQTVSGGGSTTVIAGQRTPTAESQALGAAYDAKNAEYNQFIQNNPSNFVRRRQGLPLMNEEENAAYNARLLALNQEKEQLRNAQIDAEAGGTPTIIRQNNTTTTTQTTSYATSIAQGPQTQLDTQTDPAVFNQTQVQIGSTVPSPLAAQAGDVDLLPALTTIQPAPATGAVPVDVQAVVAPTVPPITVRPDPGTDDPAEAQARIAAAATQVEPTISTPAAVTFETTIDVTAGENADTVIVPEPVSIEGDEAIAAFERAQAEQQTAADVIGAVSAPQPVSTEGDEAIAAFERAQAEQQTAADVIGAVPPTNSAASQVKGLTNQAQNQSTLQARVNQPSAADWRVRLSLAVNADYLYKDPKNPGILAPLVPTNGVIFPYTPSIETAYKAKYNAYDLTHSNYRGYFYQNSSVDEITIKGTFTAQDTREAAYLLAVIHFFRSVTKMFYGQDKQAGTPPPVCFLNGLGQYQFRDHPVLVQSFNYSLPTDVDYIRANGFNNIGLNMENRRNQSSGPSIGGSLGTALAIWNRLTNSGLSQASNRDRTPGPSVLNQDVTNQSSINSTYVPTKMDISITLLPIQTRNQVSKQFSVEKFARGDLLKGGFW